MKYGSDIPRAREMLGWLATGLRTEGQLEYADAIEMVVAKYMHRAAPDKRTMSKLPSPTRAQIAEVLALRTTTEMSQLEIAVRVGLNPGRVSEIVHGRWL